MKHTIKKIAPSKIEAVVTVDPEIWQTAQKKAFKRLAAHINIKGFRPGKAPEHMLRERISDTQIFNEAFDDAINAAYGDLVVSEKLAPLNRPAVEIVTLSKEALDVKFTVTLLPEVTLGAYKDLHADKVAPSVTDEEIAKAIDGRLQGAADLVVSDKAAAKGDTVVLDFEGFIDGVAFDGGKADNYELELGSNSFVPGFEDALVGCKGGDEKDVNITFPTQYVANLAGKPATFKCKIHEVKEKKVPVLSDESVKDLAIEGVETVEALQEHEKKALLEKKVQDADRDYYNAILKQIVDGAKIELSDEIIEDEAKASLDKLKEQVESNGLTFAQYQEITGQKEEDIMKTNRVSAEENLKNYLVLNKIAAVEKIEVTDADLEAEYAKMAETYKMKVEDVKKALEANLENFKSSLRNRKINEFILANNH